MRKKFIAGNWKMFKTPSHAEALIRELKSVLRDVPSNVDILICPPYLCVERVKRLSTDCPWQVGAQDLHWEEQGPRTGKISGDMLKDVGVTHVIVGHSEQREYFQESNHSVNKKTKAAIQHGLLPIICIGETLEEREKGKMEEILKEQITIAFDGIQDPIPCTMAYEPVWAIGTGKTASLEQAEEAHSFIRKLITELYSPEVSKLLRILYGGSVKPDNAKALLSSEHIDGALVGGASLKAQDFTAIVRAV